MFFKSPTFFCAYLLVALRFVDALCSQGTLGTTGISVHCAARAHWAPLTYLCPHCSLRTGCGGAAASMASSGLRPGSKPLAVCSLGRPQCTTQLWPAAAAGQGSSLPGAAQELPQQLCACCGKGLCTGERPAPLLRILCHRRQTLLLLLGTAATI